MRRPVRRFLAATLASALTATVVLSSPAPVSAETLLGALARAYRDNPTLNAARAEARVVDEGVNQALAGWRPQVAGEASAGWNYTDTDPSSTGADKTRAPWSVGVSISQNIFDGFSTINSTKQAEAAVRAARASLANTEQNILFSAAEAYLNVLRDQAIVNLRQQNIEVLSEQLRATRDRFSVGELTRTDVAQAEARLAGARFDLNTAEANLLTSRAGYRQVVGADPVDLTVPPAVTDKIPPTIDGALRLGLYEHPAIVAASFSEESAAFAVKVAEGSLLPDLSLQGSVEYNSEPTSLITSSTSATVLGVLSIPIYQRGIEYSNVRSAKQTRAQRRLEIDVARDQVRAAILSAWGSLQSATASIESANAQVRAAEIAFEGVREEARVGQRTTLDVLDAEQEALDARVSVVIATRDRIVASYALLQAVGRLSARQLGLAVAVYDPEVHYEAVRDKWHGLRTPSGD